MIKTVKVIPLSSSVQKDYLTYFTGREVEVGTIVTVPIRKSNVEAMVVEVGEAIEDKSALKQATFNLKKITSVKGPSPFDQTFFKTCVEASNYFAGTLGGVLDTMLPSHVFKHYAKLTPLVNDKERAHESALAPEKLVFQGALEDRISFYKTFIRESFAKKQSVYLCLPTIQDIETFAATLQKGIEKYVFVFHSDLSQKSFVAAYNSALEETHPVLIIGTGTFLFIPRDDIRTYIVEHESSNAYRTLSKPYIDMRVFAELYAYERKAKLILSDTFLRTETLYRHDEGELGEVSPISFRIPKTIDEEIVNVRTTQDSGIPGKQNAKQTVAFQVLGEDIVRSIRKAGELGEHTFLFALRKGLAPVTICRDCGTTLLCEHCESPLVLYKGERPDERIYICNKCKRERDSDVTCKHCGGWNMVPLGIGTETVRDEVVKLFPERTIIVFDKETITSEKEALAAMKLFYATPGAVLIGTELALYYMSTPVSVVGLISFDSLFSIPTFRINERILHILESLRQHANERFIIQTKNIEENILQAFKNNTLLGFYRDELAERKMLSYPPYTTMIKISYQGTEANVNKEKVRLKELFTDYKPDILDAFVKRVRGMYVTHALIRVPRTSWMRVGQNKKGTFEEELAAKLRSLPPSFKVQVDPEDVL